LKVKPLKRYSDKTHGQHLALLCGF